MRAVRYDRFGPPDVLHVVDVDEPVPRAGELKVRVRAASLNPLDWKIRDGHVRMLPVFARPPRITGTDFAGNVVGVGGGPGPRHVGERVLGSLPPFRRDGACAEFVVIAADYAVPIPDGVDDESAATLPIAGGSALQALDDAKLASGQRLLVTGAAGGVGHFAVQVAKRRGAHVVGTCSTANVEFVASLGADEVVDYTRQDVLARSDRFDVVFDVAESLGPARARTLLASGGLYIGIGGNAATVATTSLARFTAPLSGTRARLFVLRRDPASWKQLAGLVASGDVVPHIAQRVGLDDVAAAQRRMQQGHGRGKIVVVP
jgi:NADPH:quinone reductase-like Zn-dependent oxidoreductase